MGCLFLACPGPGLSHFHIRRVSLMLVATLILRGKLFLSDIVFYSSQICMVRTYSVFVHREVYIRLLLHDNQYNTQLCCGPKIHGPCQWTGNDSVMCLPVITSSFCYYQSLAHALIYLPGRHAASLDRGL